MFWAQIDSWAVEISGTRPEPVAMRRWGFSWVIYHRAPRRNFPDQRSPSTTYGFWSVLSAKIAKSSMLVDIVRVRASGRRCSPSVWEVGEVCCEGFWRDFRCHPLGCSSDRSIPKVYIAKSPISAKIDQNPDFEQNLKVFLVSRALNHCKRSQRGLRFVCDVLCDFWDTIRAAILAKRRKSSKMQPKKDTKSSKSHSESNFGNPFPGGAPSPCRAGSSYTLFFA